MAPSRKTTSSTQAERIKVKTKPKPKPKANVSTKKAWAPPKRHPTVSQKKISKQLSDGSMETYSIISVLETKEQIIERKIEAAETIKDHVFSTETLEVAPFTTFAFFEKLPIELRLRIWHIAIQHEAGETPRLALLHSYSTPYTTKPSLLQVNLESLHEARKVWKAFKVLETTMTKLSNPRPRFVYVYRKMDVICLLGLLPPERDRAVNRLLVQIALEKIERLVVSHCWFREVFLNREDAFFYSKNLDILMTEGKLKVLTIVDSQSILDGGNGDVKLVQDRSQMKWLKYYKYEFEEQNRNRDWKWKGRLNIRCIQEDKD